MFLHLNKADSTQNVLEITSFVIHATYTVTNSFFNMVVVCKVKSAGVLDSKSMIISKIV